MDRIEFFMTFIAIGVTLIDRVALHLHGLKHSQFPVKAQAATAGCFNWQSVTGSYYYRPKAHKHRTQSTATRPKANGVEGKVSVKIKESRPFSLL
jgi:hypothetical protein